MLHLLTGEQALLLYRYSSRSWGFQTRGSDTLVRGGALVIWSTWWGWDSSNRGDLRGARICRSRRDFWCGRDGHIGWNDVSEWGHCGCIDHNLGCLMSWHTGFGCTARRWGWVDDATCQCNRCGLFGFQVKLDNKTTLLNTYPNIWALGTRTLVLSQYMLNTW